MARLHLHFETEAQAEKAQAAITRLLPPDVDHLGNIAPVQVTLRWADPLVVDTGGYVIPLYRDNATTKRAVPNFTLVLVHDDHSVDPNIGHVKVRTTISEHMGNALRKVFGPGK